MWINFLWALVPIIWLIISLGIIGMPASRACTIGLIITIADAVLMFKQPIINTLSGALEGIIMGIWPIMYVILAALFVYQITTDSGSMGMIEKLLSSITTDKRILVLIFKHLSRTGAAVCREPLTTAMVSAYTFIIVIGREVGVGMKPV